MDEKKITPLPSWLTCPATTALLSAFPQAEKNVRFVGGCVRDHLIQKETSDLDLDLATTLTPDRVLEALAKKKIRTVPLGIKYGSVLAILDGHRYEISTLRRDVQTDGRQALVAFTQDWEEDARRRDFTFNALYLSPDGFLYDPWNGIHDLQNKYVRFIGDPYQRLQEDYLRILRYFRFQAWYGGPLFDTRALEACGDYAPKLQALSGERIATELFKLLRAPHPGPSLQAMDQMHLWPYMLGLPSRFLSKNRCERVIDFEQTYHLNLDPLCRLLALLPFQGDLFETVADRLKLSKTQRSKAKKMFQIMSTFFEKEREPDTLNGLLYTYGDDLVRQAGLLAFAADMPHTEPLKIQDFLTAIPENWQRPAFPLTGDCLKAHGFTSGPFLGDVLQHTQQWWIKNHFKPKRLECLTYALAYRAPSQDS